MTSLTDLQPGEVVDLALRGVRVAFVHDGRTTFMIGDHDAQYISLTDTMPANVELSVHRRIPVDGEPQPGDLWRDAEGALWFARVGDSTGRVILVAAEHTAFIGRWWRDVHNGPTGPIERVYRPLKPDPIEPATSGEVLPAADYPPTSAPMADGSTAGTGDDADAPHVSSPEVPAATRERAAGTPSFNLGPVEATSTQDGTTDG